MRAGTYEPSFRRVPAMTLSNDCGSSEMPEAEVGMLRGGPWRDIETLWCIYLRIYGAYV
jgi:hypothetical protein